MNVFEYAAGYACFNYYLFRKAITVEASSSKQEKQRAGEELRRVQENGDQTVAMLRLELEREKSKSRQLESENRILSSKVAVMAREFHMLNAEYGGDS